MLTFGREDLDIPKRVAGTAGAASPEHASPVGSVLDRRVLERGEVDHEDLEHTNPVHVDLPGGMGMSLVRSVDPSGLERRAVELPIASLTETDGQGQGLAGTLQFLIQHIGVTGSADRTVRHVGRQTLLRSQEILLGVRMEPVLSDAPSRTEARRMPPMAAHCKAQEVQG